MFSSRESSSPQVHSEKSNIKNIYQKFQNFLGRGVEKISYSPKENMISARASTVASDDSFVTPVSSTGDLMTMSPKHNEEANMTSDFLTGADFDSICDVTMHEVPMFDENMYIDATSLDFLVKCTESNRNHTSVDRAKESLFVKFDPLYARQPLHSATPESSLDPGECDVGYETGSCGSVLAETNTTSPSHSKGSVASSTTNKEKPTQVVPPVVNELTKHNITQTRSTPVLTRSVSAILTPTPVATEKLINIPGTSPPSVVPRSPRYENTNQVDRLHTFILQKDLEIMQLSQENKQLKSSLHESEHKYSQTVEDLEGKLKKLSDERENLIDRENKLIQQLNDKIMSNKQMSIVMEEYEKTISSLIGEQQQIKASSQEVEETLTSERDQALTHLSSMESSFNDLLAKYEKCKSIILEAKEREKVFEQKITEYETGTKQYEKLYIDLKKLTSDTLAKANETLDTTMKNYNTEIKKLNATIKKHEITISSLQESLAQKTRDNEELTRICDQLINEVR